MQAGLSSVPYMAGSLTLHPIPSNVSKALVLLPAAKSPTSATLDAATVDAEAVVSRRRLIHLRWGAAVGQLVVIGGVHFGLGLELPLAPLFALVAVTVLSNLVLARASVVERHPVATLGAAVVIDTLVLTGLLGLTGGPSNPFSALYFVFVALSAVLLGARWTWGVFGLCVVAFGTLFFLHRPQPGLEHGMDHAAGGFEAHLQGMLIAFVLSAGLITYFVTRAASALRDREREVQRMREKAARTQRVAALTTLAAGAAHELGTPLSTIAVAARELERNIEEEGPLEDVRLIQDELRRCRQILDRVAHRAGGPVGEAPERTALEAIQDRVAESLGARRERVAFSGFSGPTHAPPQSLVQVVCNLINNALDASKTRVEVYAGQERGHLKVRVRDYGDGMPSEVLNRIGEPFFTTKAPGAGLGLGVFLSFAVVEALGGRLQFDSEPHRGTTAEFIIPAEERAAGERA